MNKVITTGLLVVLLAAASTLGAQQRELTDDDRLKIAALEALMSAPPERALAAVTRVLGSDNHPKVKESALFILSQIETPESTTLLLQVAREESGSLQEEAIEMLGINGSEAALAELHALYAVGDEDVRDAVLDAYLIAGDVDSLYALALEAVSEDEREEIVETLAAMGATDELRRLQGEVGAFEGLIEAYAAAGDYETLREIAVNDEDVDTRISAIEALGVVGGADAKATLLEIYRSSADGDIREAALEGMLISDYDEGLLMLYRQSDDVREKREILEFLSAMGSDALWDLVDEALEEDE